MLKDYIRIIIFNTVSSSLVIIKFHETYHPNIAIALIYCNVFAIMLLLWQIFASLLIRYISIFHQSFLHDINDFRIRKIVRSLVFLISFTCLINEDLGKYNSVRWKKLLHFSIFNLGEGGVIFAHLTNTKVDMEHPKKFNIFLAIIVLDLLTLIFVQVKIELYERGLDAAQLPFQSQEDLQGNQDRRKVVTFRMIFVSLLLFFFNAMEWVVEAGWNNEEDIFESELRHRIISASIFMLGVPLILIVRNENMYMFCKKQLL